MSTNTPNDLAIIIADAIRPLTEAMEKADGLLQGIPYTQMAQDVLTEALAQATEVESK